MSYEPYPQPGTLLAERYRVKGVIGRGGMGVVLEAQNIVTERRVAIKWIHADLADSAEAGERLIREATAACRIRHPNVVDVYDVLQDGSSIFLVMDLLDGEPLEALLQRGGVPVHELVALLLPAMEGVAEAHRQSIIHRDIHPGNIFLAKVKSGTRPVPKVLDFGISKLGGERRKLTRSNISMGTPLYMSYEQLYSARDVDKRTDVYSFGVILYEALTGQLPFNGESFVEVAGQITAGTPAHPKQLRPDLPTPLAELVLWAMARNRDERIDSMESLIRELEPFASERAFRAQMTDVDRSLPVSPPREDERTGDDDALVADERELQPVTPALLEPQPPPLRGRASLVGPEPTAPARESYRDTQGHVRSPLARSVHRPTPAGRRDASARSRWLAIAAGALVVLIGAGAWLGFSRSSPTRADTAVSSPAQSPVPKAPAAPAAVLDPSTVQRGTPAAETPLAPPPDPSKPVASGAQNGAAAPARPAARPIAPGRVLMQKPKLDRRAGELRDEDL